MHSSGSWPLEILADFFHHFAAMTNPSKSLGKSSGWRIEDRFFTEDRLTWYGAGIVVVYAVHFALLLCNGHWLISADGGFKKNDFSYIWVSGNLAASSDPGRIFDNAAFSAAQLAVAAPDDGSPFIPYFVYPPTFLMFTYPLGLMPYLTAFTVWMVATLFLYQAAVCAIIARPVAVILVLTPLSVVFNLELGQNGFLTAGLIGLTLAFTECRPWLSGIFLGLLSYKPQFGILFPFVLLASRNWRALVSATATSVALGATAAIAFGCQGWLAFIYSLVGPRNEGLGEIPGWQPPLVSIFAFLQSAGAGAHISWAVQLAAATIVAVMVCAIWAKPLPHSLKAAALCIGSVLVTPYVLGYDLCVLSIAVAFLVKDALSRGFLPGERAVILMCWAGLILLIAPLIPIIICVVLLLLAARRIAAYRKLRPHRRAPAAAESCGDLRNQLS
jgi:arabinofuranan 3-O-arabinosyltransferase